MDDLRIKKPLDGSKINLHEPYEVNYWCKKFKCTVKELQNAIQVIGISVYSGRYPFTNSGDTRSLRR